jgi:glutamyl-Q tRNA(Asp) synthetase
MIVCRFAPSPTGALHLGHAWSALLGTRLSAAGRLVLRHEDIDTTRCRPALIAGVEADLAWLGIGWHGPALLQSSRRAAHDAALAQLVAMGLTYPCWCTRGDIAAAASAPHSEPHGAHHGAPAVYPGTCRGRAVPDDAAGPHAIRLDCAAAIARAGPLAWHDAVRGPQHATPERLGDIVLARRDIGVGYLLAAVVDDGFQGISDIVRGRDLFDATHTQCLLQALLGLQTPRYHHHALLLAADGRRLAKRDGAATLAALRAAGADGRALAAHLLAQDPAGPDRHVAVPSPCGSAPAGT